MFHETTFEFEPKTQWDFLFISGVLIHFNPSELFKVYDLTHRASKKYILINEYYSPEPVEINYRGHSERLFKRDFGVEMWDRYPDLKLVEYGCTWRRDAVLPNDDFTWFLFEK